MTRKVATILGLSLLALMAGSVFAQEPVAQKFDTFGKIGHCDMTARLDNFSIQLENTPGAQGAVIVYGPGGTRPGTAAGAFEIIKGYLVNARGIDPELLQFIYGGRNSDLKQPEIELWIVPKGAAQPEPEKKESNVETFQGLFDDDQAYDDFGIDVEGEMGPGIGGTTYASFADMLQQQQKKSIGYVVVYSGENLTPGAWRHLAQERIDYLKAFNLDSSQLKMIFGGYKKESRMQLWVLAKNAPAPVAEAKELPAAKTIKAGDFYEWSLRDERNQKAVVGRLADILRLDKNLRAFLVVRLETPPEEVATDEAETEVTLPLQVLESEPEPVDLTKLVEKWRLELTTTQKIGAERLIILFTQSRMMGNTISLWVVPKGQPLPDTKEDEEEEEPPAP